MRILVFPMLLMLLSTPTAFSAEERMFIDEPEPPTPSSVESGDAWEEMQATLPPWPDDADLVEFELDAASPFRYFLDGRNLSIGRDGVVRYTLVADAARGARNISVEGLRCSAKGLFRVYAYGVAGELKPLPKTDWQLIGQHSGDELHEELHGHFLCGPRTFEPRPRKDILRALKGQIAEKENSGFLPD